VSTRYAHLHVFAEQRDVVSLPSGDEVVPEGQGRDRAERWRTQALPALTAADMERLKAEQYEQAERSAAAGFQSAQEQWERDRKAFFESIIWERARVEQEAAYETKHPRPRPEDFAAATNEFSAPDALAIDKPGVQSEMWWLARFEPTHADQDETFALCPSTQPAFRPIADVLERLSSRGWDVVDVREDRTVEHHEQRSVPVLRGMRYLLRAAAPR
jgi:hypothetical protein